MDLVRIVGDNCKGGYYAADHATYQRTVASYLGFEDPRDARRKALTGVKQLKSKVSRDKYLNWCHHFL